MIALALILATFSCIVAFAIFGALAFESFAHRQFVSAACFAAVAGMFIYFFVAVMNETQRVYFNLTNAMENSAPKE